MGHRNIAEFGGDPGRRNGHILTKTLSKLRARGHDGRPSVGHRKFGGDPGRCNVHILTKTLSKLWARRHGKYWWIRRCSAMRIYWQKHCTIYGLLDIMAIRHLCLLMLVLHHQISMVTLPLCNYLGHLKKEKIISIHYRKGFQWLFCLCENILVIRRKKIHFIKSSARFQL